jgi:predicted transposase/invertase (TIGR01784 family)
MRPVFADPKTDFVFKRIFGAEPNKHLLIELLNALLELDADHRIVDLTYLPPEKKVAVEELKLSIVDVHCRDIKGSQYVVEMQVLNVEGFEKRVVYNAAKTYVMQLRTSEHYPDLEDVVGVTICDFELWPGTVGGETVPMLSRWRMQEQHTGSKRGLEQIQHVFLELPKYLAGENPETTVDRWAYFFSAAENLEVIPPALDSGPFREALEVARVARFTPEEWLVYDRVKMAEQDARGALSFAQRQGLEQGREQGRELGHLEGQADALLSLIEQRFGTPEQGVAAQVRKASSDQVTRWVAQVLNASTLEDLLGED